MEREMSTIFTRVGLVLGYRVSVMVSVNIRVSIT